MTPAQCMFDSIRHRLPGMDSDGFSGQMTIDGWQFNPVENMGIICGAVMVKDNEVHIGVSPKYQGKVWLRGLIRKELAKLFDQHEEVVTYISETHEVGHRLADMIGFEKIGMTDRGVKYRCIKVKI